MAHLEVRSAESRATRRPRRALSRAALVALAAGIAAAALLPRAIDLDEAFTIDEKLWIERSARFADAVADGRFRDAFETGHPGVTTMWIAGLAQRTLPAGADLPSRYARARLWLAVAHSALILLVWWLARGLLGEAAAALGGFVLALDPFLLAHNRVVHLDGLLALLMVASFLALLRALREGSARLLMLSGALAGLAFLTKQPAVFLVPATLVALWRDGGGIRRRFLHWLAPVVAVFFLAWPALWVRPWKPLSLMLGGGGAAVAESDSAGFFLGRRVGNPGPLFYPVAWLWRASIVTSVAGVATAVWALRRRRADPAARRALALLAFGLGFAALMTLAAKKGDRYVLPSFAAVDLAVAVGLARALAGRARTAAAAAAAGALALHGAPALALHPYELAHYNWAVGGPRSAARVMVVGWGEGLERAAARLARLPGAERLTVATTRITQFEDFFPGRTVRIGDPGARPDYLIFYISSVQTGRFDAEWRRYEGREPFWTLEINGLPYVRLYRAIRWLT